MSNFHSPKSIILSIYLLLICYVHANIHIICISTDTVLHVYTFIGHVILKYLIIIHTIVHTERNAIPRRVVALRLFQFYFFLNAKIVFPVYRLLSIYTLDVCITTHFYRLRLYKPLVFGWDIMYKYICVYTLCSTCPWNVKGQPNRTTRVLYIKAAAFHRE